MSTPSKAVRNERAAIRGRVRASRFLRDYECAAMAWWWPMIKDDCGGVWLDWPHVITLFDDDGNERDYLPERTCHEVWNADEKHFYLSCCGAGLEPEYAYQLWLDSESYCSHCGARVVKE